VQVVSDVFKGMVNDAHVQGEIKSEAETCEQSTMQRHRMVYRALSDELAQGLHALSLKTKTAEETS
jgi:stress-induced morphogen